MNRRDMLKATAAAAAGAAFLPTDGASAEGARRPRLVLRRAHERGHARHGWLDAWHSFSFGGYHDAEHMGFRALRVINEDRIQGGRGFPMHPHDNMEIVTWVLDGALEHRDTLGNGSTIRPGDVQRMSAGTGIRHSEFNPAPNDRTHLLQIWLFPGKRGIEPSYEQVRLPEGGLDNRLVLVAAPPGEKSAVTIHTPSRIYASRLGAGREVGFENKAGRHVWIQVARGQGRVNDVPVGAGDGIRTSDPGALRIVGGEGGLEVLLFDLE
ncbi:MAG: pirin family protein [Planctomycetota bacterium]